MDKNRKWISTIPYVTGYVLWTLLFRISPLFYDMWVMKHDYVSRGSQFVGVLKAVFFTGGCWKNARYLCNIINIYFVSYEWIFDFVMPLAFILSLYLIQQLIEAPAKWYSTVVGVGLFFCVSGGIVEECYTYSYVLYLLPMLFLAAFLYVIKKYMGNESLFSDWQRRTGFIVLAYLNACFLEHISCVFSALLIVFVIYDTVIKKRSNSTLVIAALVSLAQTVYMNLYLIIKGTRPMAEQSGGMVQTVVKNFRVLTIETWASNILIFSVLLIALCFAQRGKKLFLIADMAILIAYWIWMALVFANGGFDTASFVIERDIVVPFIPESLWWLWIILFIGINVFILFQLWTINKVINFLFFFGCSTLVPVLVTPNTGWRISSFYVFMTIFVCALLMQSIGNVESKVIIRYALSFVGVLIAITALYIHIPRLYRINSTKKEIFNRVEETITRQSEGEWDLDKDVLHLPLYESKDVCVGGYMNDNPYYVWTFCTAYGLNKETKIDTH